MNSKERIAVRKIDGKIYHVIKEQGDNVELKSQSGTSTICDYKTNYEIRYLHHPMYGKKVLVWNLDGDEPSHRYMVEAYPEGSCICVLKGEGNRLLQGDYYATASWDHWKPIPETKTITVTPEAIDKIREAGIDFKEVEFKDLPQGITTLVSDNFDELLK